MPKALVITAPGTITNPVGPKFTPGLINIGATDVTLANYTATLVAPSGAQFPTAVTDSTYGPVLRFDGVDDTARINPAGPAGGQATAIIVARFRRPVTTNQYDTLANFTDIGVAGTRDFSRWPDGTMKLFAGAALQLASVIVGTDVHVFTAVAAGASSVVGVDGVEVTGNSGSNSLKGLSFGTNRAGSSTYDSIDIKRACYWPRALTAAERADEVANLKQQFGLV